MKDDTISRQAAIDAFAPYAEYESNRTNAEWVRRINMVLSALPPAQPGWIPVTERLPKKDGDYLVTTHSGQIARYIFIGGSSEEYWRRCATAWMPLLEPYKEK